MAFPEVQQTDYAVKGRRFVETLPKPRLCTATAATSLLPLGMVHALRAVAAQTSMASTNAHLKPLSPVLVVAREQSKHRKSGAISRKHLGVEPPVGGTSDSLEMRAVVGGWAML